MFDYIKPIALNERDNISRICNCIKALAKNHVLLYDTSIYYAYEISSQYQVVNLSIKPSIFYKFKIKIHFRSKTFLNRQ